MRYIILLFLIISCNIFGQNSVENSNKQLRNMLEGVAYISYLKNFDSKNIDLNIESQLRAKFISFGLNLSNDSILRVANDTFNIGNSSNKKYIFKSDNKLQSIYIEEFENQEYIKSRWEKIQPLQKVFSGYDQYYFKLDTQYNVSLNLMFSTKKHIVIVQKMLPFKSKSKNPFGSYDSFTSSDWALSIKVDEEFKEILYFFCNILSCDFDKIYLPKQVSIKPKPLTSTERLIGFVNFWTEVKYNFAFFDKVPSLNWDNILYEYLPKFQLDQSTNEYYKLLSEICAKLNDGHTNIYYPLDTRKEYYRPNIKVQNFENEIYVINSSLKYKDILPLGSKIIKVNGESILPFLQKNIIPNICSSTEYIKIKIALEELFRIDVSNQLTIEYITPDGKFMSYLIHNEQDTTLWIIKNQENNYKFKKLKNNIAYLNLNTFYNEDIVHEFIELIDSIKISSKLIIDLRENSGGNSEFGYEILKYFASKPFLTSKWMTKEHKAAYKAWGQNVSNTPNNSFEKECLLTFNENYWFESPPDTIFPYIEKNIKTPVIILFGNNTASAAEDFLIAAEGIGLNETVGDLTFGSTGQPLFINLPGGGSARICTKKDTYPNGKEFVGYGIKPKYLVKPTLRNILDQIDVQLELALKLK